MPKKKRRSTNSSLSPTPDPISGSPFSNRSINVENGTMLEELLRMLRNLVGSEVLSNIPIFSKLSKAAEELSEGDPTLKIQLRDLQCSFGEEIFVAIASLPPSVPPPTFLPENIMWMNEAQRSKLGELTASPPPPNPLSFLS